MPFGFRTRRKLEIATLLEWSQKSNNKHNSINTDRIQLHLTTTRITKKIIHFTRIQ